MTTPIKDGTRWRHRIMVNGKRVSGTFDTKAAALKWEAHQRVHLGAGALATTTETCADTFRRYELEVSKQKRGYKWEAGRLAAMASSLLGKVPMAEVNPSHIAAWRDQRMRQVQGGTVTREMNLLSHVFSVARKEWKWIATSPTTDVARPRSNPPRERRITQQEIERICLSLNWRHDAVGVIPETKQQRIALAFLIAIETAMRAGEICALREGDVTGAVARLHRTKNGFPRDVPLSPRAVQIWAMVPDGFDISTSSLDAMFRVATEIGGSRADLPRHQARSNYPSGR